MSRSTSTQSDLFFVSLVWLAIYGGTAARRFAALSTWIRRPLRALTKTSSGFTASRAVSTKTQSDC
jgi:hypothetical protein